MLVVCVAVGAREVGDELGALDDSAAEGILDGVLVIDDALVASVAVRPVEEGLDDGQADRTLDDGAEDGALVVGPTLGALGDGADDGVADGVPDDGAEDGRVDASGPVHARCCPPVAAASVVPGSVSDQHLHSRSVVLPLQPAIGSWITAAPVNAVPGPASLETASKMAACPDVPLVLALPPNRWGAASSHACECSTDSNNNCGMHMASCSQGCQCTPRAARVVLVGWFNSRKYPGSQLPAQFSLFAALTML